MARVMRTMRNAAGAVWLLGAVACQTTSSLEPAMNEPPPAQPEAMIVEAPIQAEQLETVYFDLDRWELRDEARAVLKANAAKLMESKSWATLTIEGHCDERGSEEYNLALGERRANSVKQYMVDSGVSGARIDTVSFGEAKPAVQGHDESAWKWNRRVEFSAIR